MLNIFKKEKLIEGVFTSRPKSKNVILMEVTEKIDWTEEYAEMLLQAK